mmetsp:Transcript_12421/g.19438  ORF Transcript_12421/g.19438 Transcript_12421/m.19438 type:complete len:152 (-) Transcript_12421:32-487(-)
MTDPLNMDTIMNREEEVEDADYKHQRTPESTMANINKADESKTLKSLVSGTFNPSVGGPVTHRGESMGDPMSHKGSIDQGVPSRGRTGSVAAPRIASRFGSLARSNKKSDKNSSKKSSYAEDFERRMRNSGSDHHSAKNTIEALQNRSSRF